MKAVHLLFALVLMSISCPNKKELVSEVVVTAEGLVKGVLSEDQEVLVFKGIPYAQAPVDELRWKAPLPPVKRMDTLDCSVFGPAAMQADPQPFYMWTSEFIAPADRMSEDCLYLNIWMKNKSAENKKPVIVFIHGGGFASGSGAVPIYDGEAMAKKDVVFVTINYRVGIFGFLAHHELSGESDHQASGNYGLLDQVAALQWVQQNIEQFGGDPNNVTIAGQSAGAFSVNYLTVSPLAKGLFHRAIAESGGAVLPTNRFAGNFGLADAEEQGLKLEEQMGVKGIAGLRQVPAKDLMQAQVYSGPIVDGHFLTHAAGEILKNGAHNDVPLLLGWNANEGNFSGPPSDAATFQSRVEEEYGAASEEFLRLFPASTNEEAFATQIQLGALKTFGLQAFAWMNLQNEHGQSPVYMYHFDHSVPFGEGQQDFGAFHTSEVPYAYGNLDQSKVRPWTEKDYALQDLMLSYWVSFAKSGNPNFTGAPLWEASQAPSYQTMFLNDQPSLETLPLLEQLQFLEGFYSGI